MHSTIIFAAAAFAALACAIPTPVQLAPRCGTALVPNIMQIFSEDNPNTSYTNSVNATSAGTFAVGQNVNAAGQIVSRVFQAVAFTNVPAGAYGCQLGFTFPSGTTVSESSHAAMNVTTLAKGHSNEIVANNNLTFNDILTPGVQDTGLFGTVGPFTPGQTVAVNSESCPTDVNGGGNLAFLFAIAGNVETAEAIFFEETLTSAGVEGVYLTYDC